MDPKKQFVVNCLFASMNGLCITEDGEGRMGGANGNKKKTKHTKKKSHQFSFFVGLDVW